MKLRERTLSKRKVKGFSVNQFRNNEKFTLPNGVLEDHPNKKKLPTSTTVNPNLIHYHWYVFEEPGYDEPPTTSSAASSSDEKRNKPEPSTNTMQEPGVALNTLQSNNNGANVPLKQSSFISTYLCNDHGYEFITQRPTKYESYLQGQDDFGWNYSLEEQDDYKKPLLLHKLFQTLGPILFPIPFILAMIPFLISIIPLSIISHLSYLPSGHLSASIPNNSISMIPSSDAVNSTSNINEIPSDPPISVDSTTPSQPVTDSTSSISVSPSTSAITKPTSKSPPSTTSAPGQGNPSSSFPPLNPLPFPMLPGFPGIPQRNGSKSATTTEIAAITREREITLSTTTQDYQEISSIASLSSSSTTDVTATATTSTEGTAMTIDFTESPQTKHESPESDYKKILQSLNFPKIPYEIVKSLLPDLMSTKPLIYLNDTFDNSYDRKKSKLK